jgi:hypothetical protein
MSGISERLQIRRATLLEWNTTGVPSGKTAPKSKNELMAWEDAGLGIDRIGHRNACTVTHPQNGPIVADCLRLMAELAKRRPRARPGAEASNKALRERLRYREDMIKGLTSQLAATLPVELRNDFISDLPALSARAWARGIYRLEDAAYDAWAALLEEAIAHGDDIAAIAADSALEYALKREYRSLLALTRVSFGPSFELTLREPRRGRRNAEYLVKALTRLFGRNDWSGDTLLSLLLDSADPELAIKAATSSYSGERMIRDALRRIDTTQFHTQDPLDD